MFVINTDKMTIYPVAFNLYIDKIDGYKKDVNKEQKENSSTNILFFNETRLDENDVIKIQNDIKQCTNEKILLIDFQNILIKDSRNFDILLPDKKKYVIFANLSIETGFFDKAATDLKIPVNLQDRQEKSIYSNEDILKRMKMNSVMGTLTQIYCDYIAGLISDCLDDGKDGFEFLESSCVFSSKYVNIRKIFKKPEQGRFLLYCLAYRVKELVRDTGNYKLICTSKTGAIIANIISHMLNVPVVYCVGVGPKFAVKPDEMVARVQEQERYVYIFDFICIGTELKILSTFISDRKSKLICGVGPASYIRCNHPEIAERKLILNKMHPLINIQDYPEMKYEIKIP